MMELVAVVVGWVIGGTVGLVALYFVVRGAILSALREHTMSSTTAVSVTSAVPLRLESGGATAGDNGGRSETTAGRSVEM